MVGNPFELIDSGSFTSKLNKLNRVMIGHNRYATQGKVSRANAHPFEYGETIGVHNGTLHNKHVLEDGHKFDVDSQALIHHIDRNGVKSAVDKLNGAWALVWWDAVNERLNFLRNKERPLYLSWSKDDKTLLWASEKWMLEVAMFKAELEHKAPYELPVDKHVSMHVTRTGSIQDITEEEVKSSFVPFQQGQTVVHFPPTSQQRHTPSGGQTTQTHLPGIENKAGFAGSKGVKLDCVSLGSDGDGSLYIVCKELGEARSAGEIRLYIQKGDKKLLNKKIEADIQNGCSYSPKKGLHYRVLFSSVKLLREEPVDPVTNALAFIPDHHGHYIPRKDWDKKYGTCSCCNGDILPESGFKFMKNGEGAFCEQCINDPQVMQYLPAFMN